MSQAGKNTWGAGFCALLYLVVHFIPDFGGGRCDGIPVVVCECS